MPVGLEIFERGPLPSWQRVGQRLMSAEVGDVAAAVAAALDRPGTGDRIRPGMRVAIGAGSRGIDRLAEVIAALVSELRRRGAEPFIFPAMGSHGGATAAGQVEVLAHLGVTEEAVGAPVRATMDTVLVGETAAGVPVYVDTLASAADAIIPVNRVKPHTDFRAPVESGLVKMIAIGMGKQRGADTFHTRGFDHFADLLPEAAALTLSRLPLPFGLALVENGLARLALVEAVPQAAMAARERELLVLARQWLPRLPADRIDVLVIDQLGKDISGIGADTNVVNRYYTGQLPGAPRVGRIVVRGLTPTTEGNASGIGLADVVLRRAAAQVDPLATYMNCITAKTPEGARMPMTVDNDRQAIHVALACCLRVEPGHEAIARIQDTKHLAAFDASLPLARDLIAAGCVEPLAPPRPMAFDRDGMLVD